MISDMILYFTILFFILIMIYIFKMYIIEFILGILLCGIAIQLVGNIKSTLDYLEYEHPIYLYKKYKIHRIKKQLGILYKNEPFIRTDEQENKELELAYKYVMLST